MARMIEAMPVVYCRRVELRRYSIIAFPLAVVVREGQRQGRIQSAERAMPTYLTS